MRSGRRGRLATLLVLALAGSGATPLKAQTAAGAELTLPPEWRGEATPPPTAAKPALKAPPHRARTEAQASAQAKPQPSPSPAHPVDVGVVMRGGSSTSRIYGATGTSQAIQESGSAFGAGMRFGF